jgi:hypothetical protein
MAPQVEAQWVTVQLGGQYTDPVVIIGVPSSLGGQEAVARVKDLRFGDGVSACDGHCFEVGRISNRDARKRAHH